VRVFVTGGSGFVGGHVIEGLAPEHEVWAMARSDRSAGIVRGFGARPVSCDLDTVAPSHLEGCDAVVHAAAHVEEYGPRADFERVNVEGTRRLLAASQRARVARFLFVGTEAVLFDGRDLHDVDEQTPPPARHRFLYPETKAAAERQVLAANGDGFATLSIRPRLVWGPRDATILPAVLRMAEAGSFAWIDRGQHRTSTTHVANLVHALRLALETGEGGHAYFVADDEVHTIREFLTALTATQGVTLPERSIPGWLARAAGAAAEPLWSLLGRRDLPPITRLAAAMMSSTVTVRTDKARQRLGYAPIVEYSEGLATMSARASR